MTSEPTEPEATEPEAPAAEVGAEGTEPEASAAEATEATEAAVTEAPAAETATQATEAPSAESAEPAAEAPAAESAAPIAAAAAGAPVAAASPATPAPPAAPPASGWQAPTEPAGPFPGVKFADHGKRLLSYIIDIILVSVLTSAVAIVFGILAAAFAVMDLGFLFALSLVTLFLSVFFVSLVYFPYFWVKSGITPGMRVMGSNLRVVMDRDGGRVTLGPAVLRLIGYWIDALVFYLGFIWILIDSRRRGWHDLIAGTVVIQDE